MRPYVVKSISQNEICILADERDGYLVWPNTQIPFLDQTLLDGHPEKRTIESLLEAAGDGDEKALVDIWQSKDILSITYIA